MGASQASCFGRTQSAKREDVDRRLDCASRGTHRSPLGGSRRVGYRTGKSEEA